MSTTSSTADLSAGTETPTTGIYVVSHRNPAHAQPHEVRVSRLIVLPKCSGCSDVRFSLQRQLIEEIENCEFFRDNMAPRD